MLVWKHFLILLIKTLGYPIIIGNRKHSVMSIYINIYYQVTNTFTFIITI